ncbi:hypothetical protein E2C01_016719 [Portunus trituberculatus]|uniref:Uncharacterized protein n=1 Tax=Portunus trituberculatus TaxID=210409 RepID=A0A5B7DQ71_PORTR|nr:hypothetical protein [Portunus trituberculatus]
MRPAAAEFPSRRLSLARPGCAARPSAPSDASVLGLESPLEIVDVPQVKNHCSTRRLKQQPSFCYVLLIHWGNIRTQ